jgi:cellulose synthase/poly-beta-1,6-N-acetylglucosamine synthase-like glycosyltransferase/peptidoglycan/xylan/chitin deacetylase (PgdA/CDA1 family)
MARHSLVSPGRIAAHVERSPIFESASGRRGYWVLALAIALAIVIPITAHETRQTSATPPWLPTHSSEVGFPRALTEAMRACNHKPETTVYRNIPIIGDGADLNDAIFRRVVELRQNGSDLEAFDLFTGQRLRQLTRLEQYEVRGCRYAIDRFGSVPERTLVLTFDDGPDPVWTSRLLAIQQAYRAKGIDIRFSFFVTGQQVIKHPGMARELLRAGNLLGNHTLSHVEMNNVTDARAREELVSTWHIIREAADYDTRLFRLPYAGEDSDSVRRTLFGALVAQQLGMTESSYTYDTRDFYHQDASAPISPLKLDGSGQVVLMHDAGGNREATIKFVENLIQQGLQQGYQFTTIDQLMPEGIATAGPASSKWADRLSHGWYWVKGELAGDWIRRLFWFFTILVGGLNLGLIVLAATGSIRARLRRRHYLARAVSFARIRVTVLIAAYNEAETIADTIRAVMTSKFDGRVRVVVVDDGSKDDTLAILHQLRTNYGTDRLVVLHKANGGKSAALNHGLFSVLDPAGNLVPTQLGPNEALLTTDGKLLPVRIGPRGKLVEADGRESTAWSWLIERDEPLVTIDADSLVKRDAIAELILPFQDPAVEMVTGIIKPGNRGQTWWQRALVLWQSADYRLGIGVRRLAEDAIGAISIVSGALCAMRTGTVREFRGFPEKASQAEDSHLRMLIARLRGRGGKVVQSLRAVVYTEVPVKWRGSGSLLKQRDRWTFGILQVTWDSKDMVLHPVRYGPLAWLVLPYSALSFLVQMIFLPLNYFLSGLALMDGRWLMVVAYLGVFTGFYLLMLIVSMVTLGDWSWRDLLVSLYHRPVSDLLTTYLVYRAWRGILTGHPRTWMKGQRQGGLIQPDTPLSVPSLAALTTAEPAIDKVAA